MADMWAAVLFDLDDTLVDHRAAARTAVVGWARERGLQDPEDRLVERWTDLSDQHYRRYQDRELSYAEQRRARIREFLPDVRLESDAAADAAFAGYRAHYEAAWQPFPDAVPALRRARRAGATVAVLTNGDHDHQSLKLSRTGLADEVDHLVASSRLAASKPHAAAFLDACARAGSTPGRTLMVGDSLELDVRGALAAGLEAVWLDRDGSGGDPGVRRVRSLDQVLPDRGPDLPH
jgi:putative hydrolase of the HAD superfamily